MDNKQLIKVHDGGEPNIQAILEKIFTQQHPKKKVVVHIETAGNFMYYKVFVDSQKVESGGTEALEEHLASFFSKQCIDIRIKVRVRCWQQIPYFKIFAHQKISLSN